MQLKIVYSTILDLILDLEIDDEISREAGTGPGVFGAVPDRSEDIQAFRAVLSRVEAQSYLKSLKNATGNSNPVDCTEEAELLLGMNSNLFSVDCHVRKIVSHH